MHFTIKHKHWLLITVGTAVWSLTMIKSGWSYRYGLGFWGANGHDGVWHLALINSITKELSQSLWKGFSIPVFAGSQLQNYHIGFDLLLAAIVQVAGLHPAT